MIAACPRCTTRFRIAAERLREEGVRLRCTQCQSVFRVYPPHADAPRRRDDPAVEAELTPPPRPPERERIVLVADPDHERGKASAAEIARLGLHAILVHDGVEALLALQRSLPARALVDTSLPRLTGAEFCELVKRNESLRSVHVVVTGSGPALGSLGALRAVGLGPDAIVEHADLPDALPGALRLDLRHRRDPDEEEGRDTGAPLPGRSDGAELPERDEAGGSEAAGHEPFAPGGAGGELPAHDVPPASTSHGTPVGVDDAVARAERLARIVVSDIILYNSDRFERAIHGGDVLQALASELEEGRALFRQRVPAELCAERDFLSEEMLRVARSRARS